jgi:hypothetical protein
LKTQKWRIVSARENLLLQKGAWAHGQSSLSLLIFLIQLTLPLDLDWSRSKVHNLLHCLKIYTNFGGGVDTQHGGQFSQAKGLSKNPEEPGRNYRQCR